MDDARRRTAVTWGLLAAIVVLGAGLRFHAIGAKSVWLDETAALELAGRPLLDLVRECARRDTHPPLYYTLLHGWLSGSDGLARARALSAVVGTATIVALYALARRLLARGPSLVAALLLAVSAYQVYFAQEARHYALTVLLVVLSWYFLVALLAAERPRWPLWLGLALTNAAGMYTFYYHAFSIAAQLVVLVVQWRDGGRKLVVRWCVWHLLPAGLFALYLPVVHGHLLKLRRLAPSARPGSVGLDELAATGARFAAGFLAELSGARGLAVRAALALLALAAVGVAAAGARRSRRAVVVALGWLFVPLAITVFFPFKGHIYEPKHLVFAAPVLALLPAIGLGALPRRAKPVAGALVALLVGANALSLARWYDRRVEKENWRDAVSRIAEHARDGDVLVLSPPYVVLPFQYYYRPARLGRACPKLEYREAKVTGKPFRGTFAMGGRVWLLQCRSNVSIPNPRVARAFEPYPHLLREQYRDLVGTIDLFLYDTGAPAP